MVGVKARDCTLPLLLVVDEDERMKSSAWDEFRFHLTTYCIDPAYGRGVIFFAGCGLGSFARGAPLFLSKPF